MDILLIPLALGVGLSLLLGAALALLVGLALILEALLMPALKNRVWPLGVPASYGVRQQEFRDWLAAGMARQSEAMNQALARQSERNLAAWQRHCPTLARTRLVRWMIGASR